MTKRLNCEDGWALVTAMIVITIMIGIGLATVAYVDGQQREAAGERKRESSFNLSEGALNAQLFVLSRNWPGTAATPYPDACTPTTGTRQCPDAATVAASYGQRDYAAGLPWLTRVRDDTTPTPDFTSPGVPRWDSNGNNRMWTLSQAVVHGKRRTLVALVKIHPVMEPFPKNAITAGRLGVTNNGNKVIIDTLGPSAQHSQVAVRCTGGAECLDYIQAGDNRVSQISPDYTQQGYDGGNALTDAALDKFRERANSLGTGPVNPDYDVGCPSLEGPVVYVRVMPSCRYTGNASYNSTSPGILIVECGSLEILGNVRFWGVIYMANRDTAGCNALGGPPDPFVFKVHGNATLQGTVAVDGAGLVEAGSSGNPNPANLVWDDSVFNSVVTYGSAGIVQNTWREINN
jgi:type II secretory pathway pseudopilin PulG